MSPELAVLRGYELRLLRCTFLPPPPSDSSPLPEPSDHPLASLINSLLISIESGRYLEVLTSAEAGRLVFKLCSDSFDDSSADRVYSELLDRVKSFVCEECEDEKDQAYRVVVVLCIAVAAFFAFTQSNVTGPSEALPRCPLPLEMDLCDDEWDNWARNQLMAAGSDLFGKFYNVQYIVYAKMLVMRMKDMLFEASASCEYGLRSLSWWLARVTLLHQRILDDRSSSLFDLAHVFTSETLNHFGLSEKVTRYWGANLRNGENLELASLSHLEAGMMEYIYARVDSCKLQFESAAAAAGVQLSVTGVLGFRTIHQVDPKAQMVLLASTTSSNASTHFPTESSGPHPSETYETSDILVTPKLLQNESNFGSRSDGIQVGGTAATPLSAIHQAVILAKCLLIEKSARHDEMQSKLLYV